MKEITKLTPDLVGKKVKCIISYSVIPVAMIWKEDNDYYILQNIITGTSPNSMHGYTKSWKVGFSNIEKLSNESISQMYLLESEIENHTIKLSNKNKFLKINQND